MKREIWLLICLLISAMMSAQQTQRGIVKTRGRMVNGKLVAGQGLSDATVKIQGRNDVRSQPNGSFSFPVVGKIFMVQGVQKNGYQLVDADVTRKPYEYSSNIFYIVMDTPEQQQADKLAAERKLRRTLQQQLQKREDEIDAMTVSLEEKNRLLAELYKNQENNEKLIAEMAQQYASMDYDQMDSLNQVISDCIMNGELTKADSLLRSKGDINERNAEIDRRLQAEAQERAELARRQQNLESSEMGTKKLLEDFAEDCMKYHNMFKLENKHDSAMYYIELRARRDTTNATWQFDAGYYCHKQNQFGQAAVYNNRALEIYRRLASSNSQAYEPNLAVTLNNLALLYSKTQCFDESEALFKEALEIYRRLASANPQAYESDVAMTLHNLALLYFDTQRFDESDAMYKEALEIYRRLAGLNPQTYEPYVAGTLNNLANLYSVIQRLDDSEAMLREALEIRRRLTSSNPQAYEPDVAGTLNNLAFLYSKTQRFDESEMIYMEALEIYRRLTSSNPQAYESVLATTLHNLAGMYSDTQRLDESEALFNEALEIRRRLAGLNPQAYEPDVARTLNNLANLYSDTQRLDESEEMYREALDIYRRLSVSNPQIYEPDVAYTLGNLGLLYYFEMNKHDEGKVLFQKALDICRRLAISNPPAYQQKIVVLESILGGEK